MTDEKDRSVVASSSPEDPRELVKRAREFADRWGSHLKPEPFIGNTYRLCSALTAALDKLDEAEQTRDLQNSTRDGAIRKAITTLQGALDEKPYVDARTSLGLCACVMLFPFYPGDTSRAYVGYKWKGHCDSPDGDGKRVIFAKEKCANCGGVGRKVKCGRCNDTGQRTGLAVVAGENWPWPCDCEAAAQRGSSR